MKRLFIIFIILLFSAGIVFAETNVSFEWTPNIENDLKGYRVYRGDQASGPYIQVGEDKLCGPGDISCCNFTDLAVPDGTYFWVATAFDTSGNESCFSNEVTAILDSIAPAPPQEFNIFKKFIAFIKKHYMGYTVSITKTEPSG